MKVIIRLIISAILILVVYIIFLPKRENKIGYLLDIHSTELESDVSYWLENSIVELYNNKEISYIIIRDTVCVDVNHNKDKLMSVCHSLIAKGVPDSVIILDFNRMDLDSVKSHYGLKSFMWHLRIHSGESISETANNTPKRRFKRFFKDIIDKITDKEI